MKDIVLSRNFGITFFVAYAGFLLITMYLIDSSSPVVGTLTEHGFPFSYYQMHHYGYNFLWIGFIGNLTAAAGFSVVVALAVSAAIRKLTSPDFRRRWYLG